MSNLDPNSGVSRSIRLHLMVALLASAALVGGAGAWASVTNLSGAVIASGHFVVDSYVKKVQHPTGGVVGEIRVREGDEVKAGDIVIRLDATQTRANLAIVTKRLDELVARLARLETERDDLAVIVFPDWLLARRDNADVASAIYSEMRLFDFRTQSRKGKKAQLAERITQYEHEIEGLKAQEDAYQQGIEVLAKEIGSLTGLRQKGIVSDQRLNSLKTQLATYGGERGEKIAYQAQAAGRITETRLQILQVDQDLKTEVGRELREVQAQFGEYVERKIAAEDELRRIDITAPQSGIVHQLAVHTIGGVVAPADPIMLIVPEDDDLALEVQIAPRDIDQIQLGHKAVLRMSAFNLRTTPELKGYVDRIAADLTVDERTGRSYYLVRISVPHAEIRKLEDLSLVPGMPAEAMIRTGDRTALSYLVKPLSDQINRAFREE
ncbi:HlyD family type I secretion periplasmic adaptor subunit [Neorhizobium galegae]|uniref:HlyD family type I secretion periplasmic adaptor subunit n=1 Tax=Neorhizobium galegae TaxID=399 RepID=UPI0006276196|nr:HlyD family type I secretion periplasmic adaptor subunit [Neorhizobium galegae]KAA9384244.1 HlyD family type I secretion periplasmic adaptor subunit [Neorhizobium galegae]MCM2500181.1 HlyD family type I secretion periplasmic adaptor subunit [Neorhizobium galegae]MCQ1768514.1 HlyD family type I secretion periplasmic adaptor subunit [Neorhizobium galegae]MCQ1769679.1 HlyD family type I secretion periplasmic adaptor subunit [Neorhizobium galegae]MCQ1776264.1 HlyD family type I secretion peripl